MKMLKHIIIAVMLTLVCICLSSSSTIYASDTVITSADDITDTENVISEDNTDNTDSSTIQDSLSQIDKNISYMLIIQIISLGAFLGYVAIDRLR